MVWRILISTWSLLGPLLSGGPGLRARCKGKRPLELVAETTASTAAVPRHGPRPTKPCAYVTVLFGPDPAGPGLEACLEASVFKRRSNQRL